MVPFITLNICGDFNIHVDVPVGDGYKFINFLYLCDLKQSVKKPIHLHGHILAILYLIMH